MQIGIIQQFIKMIQVQDNIELVHRVLINKEDGYIQVVLENEGVAFSYEGVLMKFSESVIDLDYFTAGSVKIRLNKKLAECINTNFGKNIRHWADEFYKKEY